MYACGFSYTMSLVRFHNFSKNALQFCTLWDQQPQWNAITFDRIDMDLLYVLSTQFKGMFEMSEFLRETWLNMTHGVCQRKWMIYVEIVPGQWDQSVAISCISNHSPNRRTRDADLGCMIVCERERIVTGIKTAMSCQALQNAFRTQHQDHGHMNGIYVHACGKWRSRVAD